MAAAPLLAAGLLAGCAAHAGALDECWRQSSDRTQLGPCLAMAQRTAADEMLATFQRVELQAQALQRATGREGAVALLRASQRDFERYVQGQCTFVHAMFDAGTGADQAALACEIDLLRQRIEALRGFVPPAGGRD
jgi:uncharacterized protein YecT (DUF1311 family)